MFKTTNCALERRWVVILFNFKLQFIEHDPKLYKGIRILEL